MPNEVVIIVRAKNDTKAVFDRVRQEARTLGDDMGNDVTVHFTEKIKREAANTGGAFAHTGDVIGERMGERVTEKITERVTKDVERRVRERVSRSTSSSGNTDPPGSYRDSSGRLRDSRGRFLGDGSSSSSSSSSSGSGSNRNREHVSVSVDVNVDKQSLFSRLFGAGKDGATKFLDGFDSNLRTGFSSFFSSDFITMILKGVGWGALGVALGPLIGPAISSSILTALGGGAIAIGVVGALKDPRIKTAIAGVKKELTGMLGDFSANFKGPLEDFLASPNKSKTGGKTGLQGVLDQIKPQVDQLGKTMGEAFDKLANTGLVGLLQNALPGILRAMQGAKPFIDTLADEMPGIGKAIGQFFDTITNNSAGAQIFFKDFLNLLEKIIPLIGAVLGAFSNMYLKVRIIFASLRAQGWEWAAAFLDAADLAFGWIPGLGGKLASARKKVHQFSNDANRDLRNIHDVDVQVRLKVAFGNVWSSIHQVTSALQAIGAVGRGSSGGGSRMGGHAAGGVTGSGLSWVGEHGPELADVPAGSRIYSAPDSARMAAASGGARQPMLVQLVLDGMVLAERLLDPQREIVSRRYGGSAQAAYGRG
jgi:hypothetical protein